MKCWVQIATFLLILIITTTAQLPAIRINQELNLEVLGHTDNFYRVESTPSLARSNWVESGNHFAISNAPHIESFNSTNANQYFFRALALQSANNQTYTNDCAEDDNVNVALMGDVTNFTVIATHPTNYIPTDFTCAPNFNNCEPGTNTDYSFTPFSETTYFDGGYIIANREAAFWRPQGMTFTVNGLAPQSDIHYIQIGKQIPGTSEWPQYFVLYSDGNMRLIPFPPVGEPSVCFGSSIIIGPAEIAQRPLAEIESINIQTSSPPFTLFVTYRSGGTATIDFGNVTRSNATVKVEANYPTDKPFCTFRSMFVSDFNSDCDHVLWKDIGGAVSNDPVVSFSGGAGTEWFFHRQNKSIHNQSAPDIRVTF